MKPAILAAALAGFLGASNSVAAPPSGTAEVVAKLEPGAAGIVRTVVQGNRIEEIPLSFVGTYEDFLGPGYDLHLVKLEGPIADRVGVAAGMSGSPVYFDDRLIGALSYRIGRLPTEPIAGVTPIEAMLDVERASVGTTAGEAGRVTAISTPVLVGGMAAPVREWFAEQLEGQGFVVVGGGAAGAVDSAPTDLQAGSPVGVELVRGDMSIAATGTVTLVDEDRVYAFGHPFLGSGSVEMPMVSAEVIHTLADLAGSMKLANIGPEVGAIVEDRLPGIVGSRSRRARTFPVEVRLRGAGYGDQTLRFELARNRLFSPLLVAAVLANSLLANTGFERAATLKLDGAIRFADQPELPLEMAFANDGAPSPAIALANAVQRRLVGLWSNPFSDIAVESVRFDVDASREVARYRLESLHYDRTPLRPGQRLRVDAVLSSYRGEPVTESLTLTVPEHLPATTRLALVVGPPSAIDEALGKRVGRRLQSTTDLTGLLRAMGEMRSDHRLSAVLVRRSAGLVAGGAAYTALPPTAERLLSSASPPGTTTRTRSAELARAELEMDGPIAGSVVVRLGLDPELKPESEND